jgi:hypothetical protein
MSAASAKDDNTAEVKGMRTDIEGERPYKLSSRTCWNRCAGASTAAAPWLCCSVSWGIPPIDDE